ncbi:hypothetical protein M514_13381 [Trichuris suis]|uniref:Peptidase S1 domain-containing protein n=1 Tax=Trichuris suis TaxID=68888 RepID=A0A085NJV9_9BILA|nr:hypothetical protein M514_13381 [Trichuris suis]
MFRFLVFCLLFTEATVAFILKCGYVKVPFHGRKANASEPMEAEEADSRSFPWTVLITGRSKHKDIPMCVGSLITSGAVTKTYYALTSASCIHSTKPAKINVFYRDLNKSEEMIYKKVKVQRVLVPQIASPSTKYFGRNIGLLKVEVPIPMSEYSHVVCLPSEEDSIANATTCFVNYMHASQPVNPKNISVYQMQPKLLDNMECENEYSQPTPANTVCLSDSEGREGMIKDGAPLVCRIRKRYTIFGLLDIQTTANASMFTNVLKHLRFVQFLRNTGQQNGAERVFVRMD